MLNENHDRGVGRVLQILALLLFVSHSTGLAQNEEFVGIYDNDFEEATGAEWLPSTSSRSPSGQSFLGEFSNSVVTFTATELPVHSRVRVSFDLYIIRSWDGNQAVQPGCSDCFVGPDVWSFSVNGNQNLMTTTFSNLDVPGLSYPQAYPGAFPGSSYPRRTGAAAVSTLGYEFEWNGVDVGDATYHIERTFDHTDTDLILAFAATGLQGIDDESWGIDNVAIAIDDRSAEIPRQAVGAVDTGVAVTLSPNPSRGGISVEFTIPKTGIVALELYRADGIRLADPVEQRIYAGGSHTIEIPTLDLPAGSYSLRLISASGVMVERLVVVR